MKLKSLLTIILALLFATLAQAQTLTLPKKLVSFDSPRGHILFQTSKYKHDYWPLAAHFISQKTLSYCGVASAVMVLNSLHLQSPEDPIHAPYKSFTQTNVFTPKVLKLITPTKINEHGMTLTQLAQIMKQFNLQTKTVHANKKASLQKFRGTARQVLRDPNRFIIVNMSRKVLGQAGEGHLSPIAAYNQKNDSFLVMDTARYKYPPFWVKTKLLWKSMQTRDSASHKNRGYLVVTKAKPATKKKGKR
jgi:glutathione-S-conjugate glycine hydrolase